VTGRLHPDPADARSPLLRAFRLSGPVLAVEEPAGDRDMNEAGRLAPTGFVVAGPGSALDGRAVGPTGSARTHRSSSAMAVEQGEAHRRGRDQGENHQQSVRPAEQQPHRESE
jgi:hypothetical protein